ncbi:T9SS type A sorting domain-containing protein [Snuella sedimenti]|uniref:T9SS type A sorting domain-containing protein n=1 Tax=Snuella sedimenti TaxID=2798802 RepID=A0A8J7LPD7_9FLAO|nr:T9SS type A sorting domain-containing protein [Snuella sedimenti]MBJ6369208.1 T9SS type A sorting domain-containing protein [Snuella sedimenti]
MKKTTHYFFIAILLMITSASIAQTPPDNDLPCDAIDLTSSINNNGNCVNQTLSFNGYETNSNVGSPSCAAPITGDLWYSFTMPDTGAIRIIASFESSIYDIAIELFYGDDCNSLTSFDCDDNGNPDRANSEFFPQIEIVRPAGSKVTFRVWDRDNSGGGDFNICLVKIDVPLIATNDECNAPIDLNLETNCSPVLATNFQASLSAEANPSCINIEGDDVWFKIDIDNQKFYDIVIETSEVTGSAFFDTAIAVYSGSCGSLTEEGCDDDSGTDDGFSKVTLTNRRNETLFIRVFPSTYEDQIGAFNICAIAMESLGVEDLNIKNNFAMFPNPAKDIVHLKFNKITNNNIAIYLYDIQGKTILSTSKSLQNNQVQLDVSSLITGMYFLKTHDGQRTVTKKLIIR